MQQIDVADNDSHEPPDGAEDTWQESWFVGWYDPVQRAAGFHHVGMASFAGRADIWNWLASDGEVVARYQNLDLPLPDDDMSDFGLGPIHVQTKEAPSSPGKLGIPCVVNVKSGTAAACTGSTVMVDGSTGEVLLS